MSLRIPSNLKSVISTPPPEQFNNKLIYYLTVNSINICWKVPIDIAAGMLIMPR